MKQTWSRGWERDGTERRRKEREEIVEREARKTQIRDKKRTEILNKILLFLYNS